MIYINVEHKILTSEGENTLKVQVEIPENHLVCISGPSGVGKTTLLRIIAGLIKPDRGVVRIGETVFFDSSNKINLTPQKRNIGFMFQDYALFPNMNVEENISFAQSKIKDYQWINKLIESFGLVALRKQKTEKLSGGQKQRVALARVLAKKADILLLDEPLSAIDKEMRNELQDEIVKAHQLFGFTTLLVSHDEDEINKMASYILYINRKKIELKKVLN